MIDDDQPYYDEELTLAARALAAQGAELLSHLPKDELPAEIELKTDTQGRLMVRRPDGATYWLSEGAVWRRIGRDVTTFRQRKVIGCAVIPATSTSHPWLN